MNFKTTFVLLIIFLAVGAYLFFSTRGGDDSGGGQAREQLVLDVPGEDVVKVGVIAADGSKLLLEKSGDQWRLLQPVQAKAARFRVQDLVSALVNLKREGRVDRESAEQARSVTENPAYRVEITTADGTVHTLAVGQKSTVGNTTYVQVDGRGRVYVVSGSLHDELGRPAEDYRDMQLVDARSDAIQRIALRGEQHSVVLEKQDDAWRIVEPADLATESTAVQSLLTALTTLRANAFAGEEAVPLRTGLDHPRLTIDFTGTGETPTTLSVKIGNYTDLLRKNLYAQVGDGAVAIIPSYSFDSLNKGVLDLRSREVVSIDPALVSELTIAYDLPATTQPTTRPASAGEIRLAKQVPDVTLGPAVPATAPATTGPATTAPAATAPATTAPATAPAKQSAATWVAEGREDGVRDEDVESLLRQLNPLRATRFIESSPESVQGRYVLRVNAGEGNSYQIELIQPTEGTAVAHYQNTWFEPPLALMDTVKKLAAAE